MNNRQANGRRRGRGGQQQRPGGGNSNQGNGSRIDNRARGNAAQLHEKYKNLASDAQRQGDRVNTEYYLQFADHYFRVLSETRSRFEEQQQQRRQRDDMDGGDDELEFGAEGEQAQQPQGEGRQQREPREPRESRENRAPRGENREFRDREPRESRENRENREGREGRNGYANGNVAAAPVESQVPVEAGESAPAEVREDAEPRRRTRRPRREENAAPVEAGEGLDLAVLPPAFGDAVAEVSEEEPKKPRRRRTTRTEDAEAPAA